MQGSNLEGPLDSKFTRHVKELYPTLDELVTAGEDARAVLAHPGWTVLSRLLMAEVADIDRTLDRGRPLDSAAEYAGWHGRRGGLRAPEQALAALISRAESRLAEQRAKHEGAAEPVPDGSST